MKKLIYILIAATFCFNTVYGQSSSSSELKYPNLNGHNFPSISHFKSSFITTSFQANIGFGTTSPLKINGLKIGEHEIFEFEGKILFLTVDIEYQQRFNKWLALFFSFNMSGRAGTEMTTILADGVNTITGGNIGWLIRIKQSKKLNLSAQVSISSMTGNFINVSEYFDDLINDVPDASVQKKVPSMSAGIGINGAYAFNSMFGLQFFAGGAMGESFERTNSMFYYGLGLIGDVDFMPKQNVPIGIGLGYSLTSAPAILLSDNEATNVLTGKLGYTGSKDFELGLQYNYYRLKLMSSDQKAMISTFTLILKMYF